MASLIRECRLKAIQTGTFYAYNKDTGKKERVIDLKNDAFIFASASNDDENDIKS